MDDAQRLNISCINVVSHSRQSVPPPQIGSQLISAEKFTGKNSQKPVHIATKKGRASIKIYGNNGKYDIYVRPLASPPPIYASNNTKSLDLRERK